MIKLKRIIGAVLVLTLLISCLSSCKAKDPQTLIEKADEALKSAPYTMNISVKYDSDDEEMSEAIAEFSNPAIKVIVDGDNFKAHMDLKKDSTWNYMTYTYVDGILYTEWNENGTVHQEKSAYAEDDKEALKSSFGAGASLGIEDFDDVSSKKAGKISVITCDKIKDDALLALVSALKSQLSSLKAGVAIKDATLLIEIEDGKYRSAVLTCEYYISTSLDTYSIDMTYSVQFNYGGEASVTAPDFD